MSGTIYVQHLQTVGFLKTDFVGPPKKPTNFITVPFSVFKRLVQTVHMFFDLALRRSRAPDLTLSRRSRKTAKRFLKVLIKLWRIFYLFQKVSPTQGPNCFWFRFKWSLDDFLADSACWDGSNADCCDLSLDLTAESSHLPPSQELQLYRRAAEPLTFTSFTTEIKSHILVDHDSTTVMLVVNGGYLYGRT